jgi:hypothetical protein
LGFQPRPLPEQLTVNERQKLAQPYQIVAIRLKLSVKLGVIPFRGNWFRAQSCAGAQKF